MLKFVFLLTIYGADGTPPNVYVEDYALSGTDCIALIESFERNPVRNAVASCEIDHATLPAVIVHKGETMTLPACDAEDSANCYWDAGIRGNGDGESFYDVNGESFPFHP